MYFRGKTGSFILLLLIAAFVLNDARLIAALCERECSSLLFFVPAYIISFFSVIAMLASRSRGLRTFMRILVFSSFYTDILFLLLGGYPFSYPDALNLVNNPEYASGAILTFWTTFLLAFGTTGIVFVLLTLSMKSVKQSFSPVWGLLLPAIVFFLYLPAAQTQDFFPAPYRVMANLLNATRPGPEEEWRRAPVVETATGRKIRHIILIVDESVAADAVSLNGFPLPTTPFLDSARHRFINFGKASSFTNFSAGSNLALMSGIRQDELPDTALRSFANPGLFRYAKKAGYTSYLIDGQTTGERLQNYMTPRDLAFIDTVIRPGNIQPPLPLYLRDSLIGNEIASICESEQASFVYVNKVGAHWPYHSNYPPSLAKGDSHGLSRTAYFLSLYWNVDRFWKDLMEKLPARSEVLIIYTSDHGQNYTAAPLRMKHAAIYSATPVEGLVPLFVLDRADLFPSGFSPVRDRHAHENIFPTLLLAMGYNSAAIHARYGKSLLEKPARRKRWFHSGDLFGRGKTRRVYID